jgi:tetratricopeptide (TPR) repeat protein
VRRNNDWETEEHLFVAALDACPDSAKVRLNNGILERRKFNWEKAIEHFQRASDIDPTYCEPTYWMGLTVRTHAARASPVPAV